MSVTCQCEKAVKELIEIAKLKKGELFTSLYYNLISSAKSLSNAKAGAVRGGNGRV